MNETYEVIYAVNAEKTSTIVIKGTDTVSDVLRRIRRKEGDDGYNYIFYDRALIQNKDLFFDYYESSYVYIVTKSLKIPKELDCWSASEERSSDDDPPTIDGCMNKTFKIIYAVNAEKTSIVKITETDKVSDVLLKIREKEGDDGYKYIFYDGARIPKKDILFDYYDPASVYIVTKLPKIPKELDCWSDAEERSSDDDQTTIDEKNVSDNDEGGKEDENKKLKDENELLRQEINRLKEEMAKRNKENVELLKKVQILENENKEKTSKNLLYEKYLLSLKEKIKELTFFEFSEYEEISIISKGSTSNIKIVHKKEAEKYAMKELLLFDYKSMQRLLNESELLFKLRHPSIIRVYGLNFGDETHKPSIILSLEPKSLETAINNDELNSEDKNRISVEIVLGMRYIHKHKIIHRNLKATNILLSKNNHVRISDFGLSIEEDFEASQTKGIGTLLFMAPELFDEENKYDRKIDVYSFGVILIFIVTGKYPPNTLVRGILPKLPPETSTWVKEMINNCLSADPKNRPSFSEIIEIMKTNNYDLFNDIKDQKLTIKQRKNKENIEKRIMKIEAFEFQHQ